MSLLTLPLYPDVDQIAVSGGVYYKWTGSKWKRLDTLIDRSFIENSNIGFYSGNTVVLDTERYNYHKIECGNASIDIPSSTHYDSFLVELQTSATTGPWDLNTATYASKSFYMGAPGVTFNVNFSPDGRNLYVLRADANIVYQYTLSIPWDITSTAATASKSISVAGTGISSYDLFFKPDGMIMYIVNISNDAIYQYALSTPWDVSTATYASKSFSFATQDTGPVNIFFKPDGISLYMTGQVNDTVYQYTLATPWNISTATYASKSFYVGTQSTAPGGTEFKSDGSRMYVKDIATTIAYQYTLSTPWDVSTATYSGVNKTTVGNGFALEFKPDGTLLYISSTTSGIIYQYSLAGNISINWSDNIDWPNGVPPTINGDTTYLLEFTPAQNRILGRQLYNSSEI